MKNTTNLIVLSIATLCCFGVALFASPIQQSPTKLNSEAQQILEVHCGKCHGKSEFQGYKSADMTAMLLKKQVVPGKPDESRIYLRAVKADPSVMPPPGKGNPSPLNKSEQATLKNWIETLKPDTKPDRQFISEEETLKAIESDLRLASIDDRPNFRYFTLAHLYNADLPDEDLKAYRVAMPKLLNSLSWQKRISNPVILANTHETVFRINITKYRWTKDTWLKLLGAYPYGVVSNTALARSIYALTRCDLPYIRADWFVAHAALSPLYDELLGLPKSAKELELKAGLNPGTAKRAGFLKSGVSNNNRVVERFDSDNGAYWRSYDFSSNINTEDIFANPLTFEAAGGEIIFNLPNGLQGYMLVDKNGISLREKEASIKIVSNREDPSHFSIRNGLSCIGCHVEGMRSLPPTAVSNPDIHDSFIGSDDSTRRAVSIYVQRDEIDGLIAEDRQRFIAALLKSGEGGTKLEPISELSNQFDSILNLKMAAAEVGMKPDDFISRVSPEIKLNIKLRGLIIQGGAINRDSWEQNFQEIVKVLNLGVFVNESASAATELLSQFETFYLIKQNVIDAANASLALNDKNDKANLAIAYAKFSFSDEEVDNLQKAIHSATTLGATDFLVNLIKARIAIKSKKYSDAIDILKYTVRLYPKNGILHYMLGSLYFDQGKKEDSRTEYLLASKLEPYNEMLHESLASHFDSQKLEKDAESEYLKVINITLGNSNSILDLTYYYYFHKRYSDAIDILNNAIVLQPKLISYQFHLGENLFYAKKYENSEKMLRKFIVSQSKSRDFAYVLSLPFAHDELGQICEQQKRFVEAEIEYKLAIETDLESTFDSTRHLNSSLFAFLHKFKKYSELEERYKKLIERDPNNASVYYDYAELLTEQNKFEEAIIAYKRTTEINPKDDNYHYQLGLCFLKCKNYPETEKELLTASKISNDKRHYYYFDTLIREYEANHRYLEKFNFLVKIFKLTSKNPSYHLFLGNACFQLKRYNEAGSEFKEGIRLGELSGKSHAGLAGVLLRLNHRAEAVKYASIAIDLGETVEPVFEELHWKLYKDKNGKFRRK